MSLIHRCNCFQIKPLETLVGEMKNRVSRSGWRIRGKELESLTGRGLLAFQKHFDRSYVQGPRQSHRELFNQQRQTDMRTQRPSKIGKRLPVVVSVFVEIAVNLHLDLILERSKQESDDQGSRGENEKTGLPEGARQFKLTIALILVAVMFGLERTGHWKTQIIGLSIGQLCQLHSQFFKMKSSHLFV